MTAKEYILNKLENLTNKFPQVRVRYEYDKMADVHVIEVVPNDVYHLDNTYIAWESEVVDNFIDLFPTQNICFISDDALVGIRNAEYIFEGFAFASLSMNIEISVQPKEITIEQIYVENIQNVNFSEQDWASVYDKYMIPSSSNYKLAA